MLVNAWLLVNPIRHKRKGYSHPAVTPYPKENVSLLFVGSKNTLAMFRKKGWRLRFNARYFGLLKRV